MIGAIIAITCLASGYLIGQARHAKDRRRMDWLEGQSYGGQSVRETIDRRMK